MSPSCTACVAATSERAGTVIGDPRNGFDGTFFKGPDELAVAEGPRSCAANCLWEVLFDGPSNSGALACCVSDVVDAPPIAFPNNETPASSDFFLLAPNARFSLEPVLFEGPGVGTGADVVLVDIGRGRGPDAGPSCDCDGGAECDGDGEGMGDGEGDRETRPRVVVAPTERFDGAAEDGAGAC